jgi:hypothetical protein
MPFSKKKKKKKKHTAHIEELVALKSKLINREVEWEAVTPEFESLWTLEKMAVKAKPKRASKAPSQQSAPRSPLCVSIFSALAWDDGWVNILSHSSSYCFRTTRCAGIQQRECGPAGSGVISVNAPDP